MERKLVGIPASPGIAVGPVHLLRWEVPEVRHRIIPDEAIKGEITLLIGKHEEGHVATATANRPSVRQRVDQIMLEEKIDEKAALKRVAKERGVSKSEVY